MVIIKVPGLGKIKRLKAKNGLKARLSSDEGHEGNSQPGQGHEYVRIGLCLASIYIYKYQEVSRRCLESTLYNISAGILVLTNASQSKQMGFRSRAVCKGNIYVFIVFHNM